MEEQQKIEMYHPSHSYKIIIPENVENKIRYMCQKVSTVEWSGALFYNEEGTFEDDNLVIICKDIFIMDIGSAAYTEFDMNPDVISYMAENPELLDYHIGLIHSHNNMPAFFSGTDTNTLKEEGRDRNHFVSLIVNNAGVYTAGITRRITSKREIKEFIKYPTFNDNKVETEEEYTEEETYLEWFNLDIVFENNDFREELESRLKEVKEKKNKYQLMSKSSYNTYFPKYSSLNQPSLFDDTPYTDSNNIDYNFDYEFSDATARTTRLSDSEVDEIINNSSEYTFDPEIIKSLVLQIITGSVLISKNSKIVPSKWVNTMKSLLDERFGTTKEGFEVFKEWANSYIEFLVFNTVDPKLKSIIDEDYQMLLCAEALEKELRKLPTNKYMEEIINIVNLYVNAR